VSNLYIHKRYFRLRKSNDSLHTFSNVADAVNKIGFAKVWNTSSPTTINTLIDSNTTLVVSYEFENEAEQVAFKSAIDNMFHSDPRHFSSKDTVEHFKTEWLHKDGSLSHKTDFVFTKKGRDIAPAL